MSPDRWQLITDIFYAALDREASARPAFLEEACASDGELRSEVDALLKAHFDAGAFGTMPPAFAANLPDTVDANTTVSSASIFLGSPLSQIQNYRVVRKLGEGGMGEVYEVEQTQPLHRRAALKLIKAGLNSKEVVARFDSERQALALMSHPNIAAIFDGGSTEEGRPYFVMEYVEGARITEYCDSLMLNITDRLKLYQRICEGVQHAHRKGIIHRDLKPSNVLVTIQGGHPIPKIIDFGLAKAMEQKLTAESMFTQAGMVLGTPAYMSPEQVLGKDLDTRTDVYSLGVLLYELLIGVLPFDVQELSLEAWGTWQRKICEEEPPPPSTRITGEAAQRRQSDQAALAKQLRGDLNEIALKALEKDRSRRYGSPAELAADIERYLRHEPVLATPPSRIYLIRKFVRRHRLAVATSSVAAIALLLGTIGTTIGLIRATRAEQSASREAENARQVADFLVGLFQVSDPMEGRGNSITAREILDKGAEKIDRELEGQPLVRAQMMSTMGQVYTSLGLFPEAQSLLEKALSVAGDSDVMRARAQPLMQLAWLELQQGKSERALAHYKEALPILEEGLGPDHSDVARALTGIGIAYRNTGKHDEARVFLERSLANMQKALGPEDPQVAEVMAHLGWLHNLTGKYQDALDAYERALAIKEKVLGADHPNLAWFLNDIGVICSNMGDYAGARRHYERSLALSEKILGPDHPQTAQTLDNLGTVLLRAGTYQAAHAYYQKALTIREKKLGPQHIAVASSLNNVALSLRYLGDNDTAEILYERSLAIKEKNLGTDHAEVAVALSNLAYVLFDRHDANRALKLQERAVAIAEKSLGPEHPDVASLLVGLSNLLPRDGNFEKAHSLLSRALAIREKTLGPQHSDVANSLASIADLLLESGRAEEAKPLYQRALTIEEKAVGRQHPMVAQLLSKAASAYERTGDYPEAKTFYERALSVREKSLEPAAIVMVGEAAQSLGEVHRRLGSYEQARTLIERALAIAEEVGAADQENAGRALLRLALLYAAQGDRALANAFYDRASAVHKRLGKEKDSSVVYAQARYSALLDDRDNALALIKRAIAGGIHQSILSREADFASLHGDPQFEFIARKPQGSRSAPRQ